MTTTPLVAAPERFPPAAALDDDALARRVADGDERAFDELYRRYRAPISRYCASILGDPQEAEEALQSVMLSAYRSLHERRQELRVRPWLYRVAHNQCLDLLRRRREAEALSGLEEELGPRVDERVALREDLRQLRRDLAALRPEQRAALVLREMSGLSHAEIAETLNASPAAAKQLIHDARRNLVAFEAGRGLPCDDVQRAISDNDGRVLRGGAIRGHLRGCPDCSLYRSSIRGRGRRLEALFPPLAPVAAEGILAGVAGSGGGGAGGALLGAGGVGGGLAVKIAAVGTLAVAAAVGVGVPLGLGDLGAGSGRSSGEPAPAGQAAPRSPAAAGLGASGEGPAPAGRSPRADGADAAAPGERPAPGTPEEAPRAPGTGAPAVTAAVGPIEAGVSADPGSGAASAAVAAGGASVEARADASTGSAGASAAAPGAGAGVTVEGGAAGASVEVLGESVTVEVAPVLPVLP